jgi:hypothetical protein
MSEHENPEPTTLPEPAPGDNPPGPDAAIRAVDRVEVDQLEFSRGAIGGVRASDVTARLAVIGGVAAGRASVRQSMVGGMAAREATVEQGIVRGLVAQEVHLEQSIVRSAVAGTIHAGPSTAIVFAVARQIDGEAKVLFDWRGALAFGAVLAALVAVIRLGRRA